MLDDIELKLLFGKPINVGVGNVYPLTINDVVEMGENTYNQYLNILLYDVSDLDIEPQKLKEMGIDKFTTYHFLLLQAYNYPDFKKSAIKAFELFLKEQVTFDEKQIMFCVGNPLTFKPISLNDYLLMRRVLIKQNFLKELEEEEDIKFGNELARQWYMEMKRVEKNQPKPKTNMDLQSIISAVNWKGKRSFEEISKMTVYQLHDGFYRLSLIDNCDYLNQGIYHGTVSQKDIKQSDLNWAKIIQFNE